nr:HNH endonuclease signature motif containing protein [Microbacterium ulmi]
MWCELDALVSEVEAARARIAEAQALEASLLARAVDLVAARTAERTARGLQTADDLPLREVSAELGAAMRVGDRTVQRRINDAHTIVTRFVSTHESWRRGEIERAHAAIIAEEGVVVVDDGARAEYEQLVLAVAKVESAARLREIARAIAARIDPDSVREQRAIAASERRVRVYDLGDGLARLLADLPAPLAHAIADRLTQQARLVRDPSQGVSKAASHRQTSADPDADSGSCADTAAHPNARGGADGLGSGHTARGADTSACRTADGRTLDQVRADVLADTLLTAGSSAHAGGDVAGVGAIRGAIQVTIPLATLAGVSDDPVLLAGSGPVDPDLVRALAAAAPGWDRVFTDAATGLPVAVDRYRPSAELRRFLAARDERCRFPGCRRPAASCDVDHTVDAAFGGATSACNLGQFCRRHHTLKHASPWTVEQVGAGVFRWTSPTGRIYDDRAPSTMRHVDRRERRRERPRLRPAVAFGESAPT